MQLIPAGIVLVLCLRRIVLVAERKLVARRRASAAAAAGAGAGVVAAASMPFCSRWLAVVERPLLRPVGVKFFRDWTWLQFVLLNFTLWSAVALNLVRSLVAAYDDTVTGADGLNAQKSQCTLYDMRSGSKLSTIQYLGIRTGRTSVRSHLPPRPPSRTHGS